jgi:hypothetical protein
MKSFTFILILSLAINCQGQDTAKHQSRSSLSLTGGTNIVYPGLKEFRDQTFEFGPYFGGPVYDFTVTPLNSVNPMATLNLQLRFSQAQTFIVCFKRRGFLDAI